MLQWWKTLETFNPEFEGCFINYPDIDMKYTDGIIDNKWLTLYYGNLASELIATKSKCNPNNIFNHDMSIPVEQVRCF